MAKTIVTHDKSFHCDEVCAYAILNYLHENAILYRTRSKIALEKATFVVDVGGVYDPETDRYDHHQPNFKECFTKEGFIPMSSAGLVWKHYGKAFIKKYNSKLTNVQLNETHNVFYKKFIQEIDAHDNGVRQCDHAIEHKYHTQTVLGNLVSDMNGININDGEGQMANFKRAAEFVLMSMKIKLDSIIRRFMTYETDKKIIKLAMENSYADGQIIYIDTNCPNWLKCIHEYEKNNNMVGKVKFVIYESNSEFRIKTIEEKRFTPRIKIKNEQYLKQIVEKPEEIIFVHKSAFIGAATTFGTAMEMALKSFDFYTFYKNFREQSQVKTV